MRKLGFRSSLVVPLRARGEVLGALALFSWDAARRYGEADLPLAEDLARRVALAIDHARLYREAREAVGIRDEFLSVAAHELKTPLTGLLGFVQVLLRQSEREGGPDERVVRRALQAIERQSDRLSRLVSQLLDVSRIEGGRLVLERQMTDLASLVAGLAASLGAHASRHTLVVQAPTEVPALVDPLRLEQVVMNLLDNAIKYSPEGGRIDVQLSQPSPEMVRLAVRDRGIGIPPETRQQIFDRFYQAHTGNYMSGMGLGLYISRQIVELHGGSIRAEFPPDGGTCFIVDLPTSSGDAAASRMVGATA
jgi:signal transduction histidine kinase